MIRFYDNNFPEYEFLQYVQDVETYPITCLKFDRYQDLLWTGNLNGHVSSFYGPTFIRYTSFQSFKDFPVLAICMNPLFLFILSKTSIRIYTRGGLPKTNYDLSNIFEAFCFINITDYQIVIGGSKPKFVVLNISNIKFIKREEKISKYTCCELIKATDLHIATAHGGKICLRDYQLKRLREFDSKQNFIVDFDISHYIIICCGAFKRNDNILSERFIKKYDVRSEQSLTPIQLNLMPCAVRFIKTYTERMIAITNDGGYQLFDVQANQHLSSIIYNFQHGQIVCMDVAGNNKFFALGDALGGVQIYRTDKNAVMTETNEMHFNILSFPTEFPDHATDLPILNIDDFTKPVITALGENSNEFNCIEKLMNPYPLASDWPLKFLQKFDRNALPISADVIENMKMSHFVGYVPAPPQHIPNGLPYDPELLQKQLKCTDLSYISEYAKVYPSAPKYYDPLKASKEIQTLLFPNEDTIIHYDNDNPVGNFDKNDNKNTSESLILVPQIYGKQYLRNTSFKDKINYHDYNPTHFPTLLLGSQNTYINAVLQMLYFIQPFRSHILNHLCEGEFCLSCELAFLYHMMDSFYHNEPVQPLNLVKTFKHIPTAHAFGLILNEENVSHDDQNEFSTKLHGNYGDTSSDTSSLTSSPLKKMGSSTKYQNTNSNNHTYSGPEEWKKQNTADSLLSTMDIPRWNYKLYGLIQTFNRFLLPYLDKEFSLNSKGSTESIIRELFQHAIKVVSKCCECQTQQTTIEYGYTITLGKDTFDNFNKNHDGDNLSSSMAELINFAMSHGSISRAWCENCQKFQSLHFQRNVVHLPHILIVNICETSIQQFKQVFDTETISKSYLISRQANLIEFTLKINGQQAINDTTINSNNGKDGDDQNIMHSMDYEILGIIEEIDEGHKGSHLVDIMWLESRNVYPHEKNWVLFNNFCVFILNQENALDFSPCWKKPSILYYVSKDLDTIMLKHNKNENPIDLKLVKSLMTETHTNNSSKDGQTGVVFLNFDKEIHVNPHEFFIALDAEFVVLNQTETILNMDGSHTTLKQGHLGAARITCLRGFYPSVREKLLFLNDDKNGIDNCHKKEELLKEQQTELAQQLLEGVPFIDQYIKVPEDQIVDYVTKYSGIQLGDLHHLSDKNPVSLKKIYVQLRYFIDHGYTFVGHNLTKDFQIINIMVPKTQMADTSQLFRLPNKRSISLKFLVWYYFGKVIQSDTHDSVEDAFYALKLYNLYMESFEALSPHELTAKLKELYNAGHECGWTVL